MAPKKNIFCILLLLCKSLTFTAQETTLNQHNKAKGTNNKRIAIVAGDAGRLAGNKKINISYDYSEMSVGKFKTEDEFLKSKTKYFRDTKAAKFIEHWRTLRENVFEIKFAQLFNKNLLKAGMYGTNNSKDANISLHVEIIDAQPDYHSWRARPSLTVFCTFTDENDQMIVQYELTAHGSKDKSSEQRLTECYGIAGKMLAKDISKQLIDKKKSEDVRN
jgi:hypothetical protein